MALTRSDILSKYIDQYDLLFLFPILINGFKIYQDGGLGLRDPRILYKAVATRRT